MENSWRIELLGRLRVEAGGRVVTRFPTQKAAALLAYLAFHLDRAHPRETLTELLWPEADREAARHRLNVALSSLRQQLAPPETCTATLVLSDRLTVQLNPAAVTTDVAEFKAAVAAGLDPPSVDATTSPARIDCLTRAVELYRGALLTGFYEDWVTAEQQRLEARFFQALHPLIALLEQSGDRDRALQYALRGVSVDPLREDTQHELIRLYAAAGQTAAALRQYRELERILQQELGETPSPATQELVREIRSSGLQVFRSSGLQADPTATPPLADTPAVGPEHLNTRTPEHPSPITPSPLHPFTPAAALEPVGGATPLGSPFYVERAADQEFHAALARGDSIVLIKGARQIGKTSLLARGLLRVRQSGVRVAVTDLERLNAAELLSAEALLLALAQGIVDELELEISPRERWTRQRGPNANFQRFLERDILGALPSPIVWALDEVDRLFDCPFAGEIFGLFRSWHNARTLEPDGPWSGFTLALAYATEAHLFITDLNKSPFNVGTRIALEDFTHEQVAELNRRTGSPLADEAEVARYYHLVGGHPYLARRGLYEMSARGLRLATLESRAASDEFVFGDHLQRMYAALTRDAELCEAMRAVLRGLPCPSPESFYRLRTAGLLTGDTAQSARPRCQLYAAYLEKRLDLTLI